MITNAERMEAEYKDCYILITDKKISSINDIVPIIGKNRSRRQKRIGNYVPKMSTAKLWRL